MVETQQGQLEVNLLGRQVDGLVTEVRIQTPDIVVIGLTRGLLLRAFIAFSLQFIIV